MTVAVLLLACGDQAPDQGSGEPGHTRAAVEHELDEHALWASDADDPEEVTEEFLHGVLGWSTDPVIDEEDEPELTEHRPVQLEAEGPEGQAVFLEVGKGEPRLTGLGMDVDPPEDERWRVLRAFTGPETGFDVDPETDVLTVHLPGEQERVVLMLHVGGESRTHLLDEELDAGAETQEFDLADLGFEEPRRGDGVLWVTALVIALDGDDRALGVAGQSIVEAPLPDEGG